MNLTELKVVGINGSKDPVNTYVLILRTKDDKQDIPIIIGTAEAQAIIIRLRDVNVPRPMTHDLFHTVINELGGELTQVIINERINGIYHAQLHIVQNGTTHIIDARSSDAVALAIWSNAPIFVSEQILDQTKNYDYSEELLYNKSIWYIDSHDQISPKVLNDLEQKLKRAVVSEDYEQAAKLRDQISKLKS